MTAIKRGWQIRIIPFVLALGLGGMVLAGCSPTLVRSGLTDEEKAALTPAQQVFVIEADYLINKADFAEYAELPKCDPSALVNEIPCHLPKVVKELRRLDVQIQDAFKAARVATGPELQAKLTLARALIRRFLAILIREGIIEIKTSRPFDMALVGGA